MEREGQRAQRWAAPWQGYFGYVAGALGHTVEARSVIEELQGRRQKDYSPALPIAWTYLGLGETASALEWLERALAERDPFLGSAMVFPAYDAIRDQPNSSVWLGRSNSQHSGASNQLVLGDSTSTPELSAIGKSGSGLSVIHPRETIRRLK